MSARYIICLIYTICFICLVSCTTDLEPPQAIGTSVWYKHLDTVEFYGQAYGHLRHRGWDVYVDTSYQYFKWETLRNVLDVIDSAYQVYPMDSAAQDNVVIIGWTIHMAEFDRLKRWDRPKLTKHQAPDYVQGVVRVPYPIDLHIFIHELGHSWHTRTGRPIAMNQEIQDMCPENLNWLEYFADMYAWYYLQPWKLTPRETRFMDNAID